MGTCRLTWYNPFGHWSTQNAFLSQIYQNSPSQAWVEQKSNLVKTTLKQNFSQFYNKPELVIEFC